MEGYMTIKQAAEKWEVTPRRIQKLCVDGRIDGATKFGRDWAIPADAAKPEDKRVTTGKYRNFRFRDWWKYCIKRNNKNFTTRKLHILQ